MIPGAPGFTMAGTTEVALRNAASWACMNVLADAVSRTPFDAVRYMSDGTRQDVDPEPKILDRPSNLSTFDVWLFQAAHSAISSGNAFGVVTEFRGSYPSMVEWLDPSRVHGCVEGGRKLIKVDGRDHKVWQDGGDAVHIPGKYVLPGSPFGISPVAYASRGIGASLAAEDYINSYFTDGAHPTWGFKSEKELTEPEALDLKARIRAMFRAGSREPFVHGSGLTPHQYSTDPNETKFIDLLQFEVLQACRFWGVPPSMVFAAVSGQNVTYANVTDADLAFLKHSLDGYLVRFEKGLTELLPRPQVVKANRDAVLRADPMARHTVYDQRLKNRTITVNEVRTLEDEAPFDEPEFDDPGIPGGPQKIMNQSVPPPAAAADPEQQGAPEPSDPPTEDMPND